MSLIWSLLTWALFGLIIGAVARLLYPGRQPMGLAATMALGIVGSLLGGFLSWLIGGALDGEGPFRGAGWIMSIVGALIVVWLGLFAASKSGGTTGRRIP